MILLTLSLDCSRRKLRVLLPYEKLNVTFFFHFSPIFLVKGWNIIIIGTFCDSMVENV